MSAANQARTTTPSSKASLLLQAVLAPVAKLLGHKHGAKLTLVHPAPSAAIKVELQPGVLVTVWSRLTEDSTTRAARIEQAYLNEATDRYDLEYRMRSFDRQRSLNSNGL
jgi:hypothetical protein